MNTNRYEGKPFLRLLECYVLDAIGALEPKQREILERMKPKLESTFNTSGSWTEIVAQQMGFPHSMRDQIVEIWQGNVAGAQARGTTIDPNEFVRAFVDENFPDAGT